MMALKTESKYNSIAVAVLRSSSNELLPVGYIDTELNKQFPNASDLKQN